MDSTTTTIAMATSSSSSSKRLLFDRRYGWVFDEWKDPSKEALTGGRGMFCILPLAKAMLETASQSINLAARSTVRFLESPDELQHQLLKFTSSMQKPDFNLFTLQGKSHATSCPSNLGMEGSESQMGKST